MCLLSISFPTECESKTKREESKDLNGGELQVRTSERKEEIYALVPNPIYKALGHPKHCMYSPSITILPSLSLTSKPKFKVMGPFSKKPHMKNVLSECGESLHFYN